MLDGKHSKFRNRKDEKQVRSSEKVTRKERANRLERAL